MNTKPLVTICIPNYNYGHYLEHCLESVYNQTYENIEVHFSDNASTDNSYDIAHKFRKKFKERGWFFELNENKRNVGSDKNSKIAASGFEGDYLYTLASDDAINPTFIERCIEVLENNPNVGTVITNREEIDENDRLYQIPPFYNVDCIVDGESQAAVYMMAGVAIPGQRMVRGTVFNKIDAFARQWQVAGDWYDNFLYAMVGDVAYITEPLCQYRVHTGNETNESELRLLGTTEHYQLINTFCSVADSFGMTKPQTRYEEAVHKLGSMCLRYALKMYKNKRNDVAYRYLLLAPVYYQDILWDDQYKELLAMRELQGAELEKQIADFEKRNVLERKKSYDPPEGFVRIDKNGMVIKED
ncbi:MAG: glycosyltransferase family 2 protein [Ruminococcus flavefaciens]|nr:glycosyltransferase family 2 protein [Ruminococcus flavefaciens]